MLIKTKDTIQVSIIIINYNTSKLLLNCIKSIYENTKGVTFEIIVVDNASIDDSIEKLKLEYPQVILVESKANIGFGKANNLGVKYAIGKYLFLLNSDTIFKNNALFYFSSYIKYIKDIGCIGSFLFDQNGKHNISFGAFPNKKTILFQIVFNYFLLLFKLKSGNNINLSKIVSELEVDYITGADLFITKALFEKMGGFDPDFFMYFEETDLQKRIEKLGLKRIIIDGPRIVHLEGASSDSRHFSAKKRIMFTNSMFIYFKKHSTKLNYFMFRLIYFILRLPLVFDRRISINNRIEIIKSHLK